MSQDISHLLCQNDCNLNLGSRDSAEESEFTKEEFVGSV